MIFPPGDRLYQTECTHEAVKRGTANIGIRTPESVILTADKRSRSPLIGPTNVGKTHKTDDRIGITGAGHTADTRQFIDFAHRQLQVNRLRYGEPIGIETLTREVAGRIQQHARVGGACPFSVAFLVGGIENSTPRLYGTDPSGAPYEWKTVPIGVDCGDHQKYLEENFRGDPALDEGIELALEAIASTNDGGAASDGVDVAIVSMEMERFVELPNNKIESYFEANDPLAAEGDEQIEE